MEGVAGISRPRRRLFPGGESKARSLKLPSGGIRPPPSEGQRAVRSPSFTARFFWLDGVLKVALHEDADRAMVIESCLI